MHCLMFHSQTCEAYYPDGSLSDSSSINTPSSSAPTGIYNLQDFAMLSCLSKWLSLRSVRRVSGFLVSTLDSLSAKSYLIYPSLMQA